MKSGIALGLIVACVCAVDLPLWKHAARLISS